MNVQYQHSFCCNKLTLGSIYDIANVVYGAAFKSALFNEEKVGYPLIRIRDLSTFSPQYWTNEAHPKRVFVHPGDVLAGMDAEFTPCLWQGEMAVLNQRVCLFEPAANSGVSRSYLLMALNHCWLSSRTTPLVLPSRIWEKRFGSVERAYSCKRRSREV